MSDTLPREKNIINFNNVGISFSIKRGLFRQSEKFWALKDISFRVDKDEIVGIVGRNGTGKSTCGRLIAGIYQPTKGSIEINGTVTLLSFGAGFNPEFTGRQNILVNGVYQGFTIKAVKERMNDIIAFSELGDFIDRPLKTYSYGMKSRLGFSVAAFLEPDILVLDEVMATGDYFFKKKAMEKINDIIGKCNAVIVISHQDQILKELCNRVLWFKNGGIVLDGEPRDVLQAYKKK